MLVTRFRFHLLLTALLLGATASSAAWTQIKVVAKDQFGRPMRGVSATLLGGTANEPGRLHQPILFGGCSINLDTNGVGILTIADVNACFSSTGQSANFISFDTVSRFTVGRRGSPASDTTVYTYSSLRRNANGTYTLTQNLDPNASAPNSGDSMLVIEYHWNYKWAASPDPKDSGSFKFPGVPYQIVYDPPGDGSSASLTRSGSFATSVTASFATGLGASLSLGYEYENAVFNSGASIDVTASVKYNYNKDNNFSAVVTQTETIETSSDADESMVGPGRGDLLVCPSMLMKWRLYRVYLPADTLAHADGYVYRLNYTPVADPSNTELTVSVSQLADRLKNSPGILTKILDASAIDPATNRIRSNLLDAAGNPVGNRLVKVQDAKTLPVGGARSSLGYDSTVSQTTTVSQSFEVGTEVAAKLKVGGFTAGATLTASLAIGGSKENNQTFTRSITGVLTDANPWDQIRYTTYLDRTYGTYVFDVDPAQSWTSFPHEAGYSSEAVRLNIQTDRDTLFLQPGAVDTFRLAVSNGNWPGISSLDLFGGVTVGSIVNSGASVTADGNSWNIDRNARRTFRIAASAADTGTYDIVAPITGSVGGVAFSQDVPLTLVVSASSSVAVAPRSQAGNRLVGRGDALRIECAADAPWTLRIHGVDGRQILNRTGQGSAEVALPAARGIQIQTLEIAGERIQRLSSRH